MMIRSLTWQRAFVLIGYCLFTLCLGSPHPPPTSSGQQQQPASRCLLHPARLHPTLEQVSYQHHQCINQCSFSMGISRSPAPA
jgi:hypothetical protein